MLTGIRRTRRRATRRGLASALVLATTAALAVLCAGGISLASDARVAAVNPSIASSGAPPTPSSDQAQNAVTAMKVISGDPLEMIRLEREMLERQADRQMEAVRFLFQLSLGALGLIAGAAALLFTFFFGSTKKELKESLHTEAERQVVELVEKEAQSVRQRLRDLQAEIDALQAHRRRPISWVTADSEEPDTDLLAAMNAAGLSNVQVVSPQTGQPFSIGSPDLVILCYDASAESSRRLALTLDSLRDRSPPVPIVVHTFGSGRAPARISQADEQLLSTYRWYVPTNVPLQLIAQASALLTRVNAAASL